MSGSGVAISKRKNLSPSATSYGGELGLNVSF